MIEIDRVRSIAKRLLEKTRSGLVNWSANHDDATGKGCVLLLNNSTVELTYRDDTAEAPTIRMDIINSARDKSSTPAALATLSAYDSTLQLNEPITDPQDASDSVLLIELYREATRVVYEWDVVLADIDDALSQPGRIGLAEPVKKPSPFLQASPKEPAHAPRR